MCEDLKHLLERMKQPIKVLFLDIDGVLNNQDFFDAKADADGKFLLNVMSGEDMIDPKNIAVLNKFLEETDAYIVISSTWRRMFKRIEINDALISGGFKYPQKVIGMTPVKFSHCQRSTEIQLWLEDNYRYEVTGFAVVDDNHLGIFPSPVSKHLVLTKFCHGLLDEHVPLLKEKLELPF